MARTNMKFKRKRLLKERGHKCEVCDYPYCLYIHHIIPHTRGGSHEPDNLIILCEKCHADAHGFKKKSWIDETRKLLFEAQGY